MKTTFWLDSIPRKSNLTATPREQPEQNPLGKPVYAKSHTYLPFITCSTQKLGTHPACRMGETVTHVAHVLGEQVLQRLADGVAFGDDPLPVEVPGAGGVGQQSSPADDGFKALL